MKNKILLFALSITLFQSLYSVDVKWQLNLPAGTEVEYSASGPDGSAIVIDANSDVLYWIGSDGSMIETIQDFNGGASFALDNSVFVSNTQLIIPVLDWDFISGNTKIITKTDSGHSLETLSGIPGEDVPLQSSAPFFNIVNSLQVTQYKIDLNVSASNYGVATVPANAIVIPASHEGDVTISLESSIDLVEWTPVLPGVYSSTNEGRFFRVRATPSD